jgi:hypothetical protein
MILEKNPVVNKKKKKCDFFTPKQHATGVIPNRVVLPQVLRA